MAQYIFPQDVVLNDRSFLQLGFSESESPSGDDFSIKARLESHFDRDRAISILRSNPDLAARFLSQTKGNGIIYWTGDGSSSAVDGRSIGVNIIRRRTGEEAVGDNAFGRFLDGVRQQLRRELSDILVEEVPVGEGQVICDFTRKDALHSDIELREMDGESFIHVDVYRPARFRHDTSLDGTTGHASRLSDSEVPFHKFVCPFGVAYPSPVIVGSAAEASVLYEQAIRGELDWKALFNNLRDRNLLDSKLTERQVESLIADYKAQFDWMRDEIVNNPELRHMPVVASSHMIVDSSLGRSVYDAQSAPSPAHVLARYINNPLLLFVDGENGVYRSLSLLDKDEPERFSFKPDQDNVILVVGSDTIGGRMPGQKATLKVQRKEETIDGQKVISAKKVYEMPMKSRQVIDAEYKAFSERMDLILSDAREKGVAVTLVSGNVSGNGVGVGSPRLVERYVKEHGGAVLKYNYSNNKFIAGTEQVKDDALRVLLLEHFADCLPALTGQAKSVDFRLDSNDPASLVSFRNPELVCDGVVCFSDTKDTNVRNVLSGASFAANSGVPVIHVQDNQSEAQQRESLERGALASRSGYHGELPSYNRIFEGEQRGEWSLEGVNHLSMVDDVSGLHIPFVADVNPSPVIYEGQSYKSVLSLYVAMSICEMLGEHENGSKADFLKSVAKAEGSSLELINIYNDFFKGDAPALMGDFLQEECLRRSIRLMAEKNSAFAESLLELDGSDVVMSCSHDCPDLFVSAEGKGLNRFGIALSVESKLMKEMKEARRVEAERERERLLDEAAKRQKLAIGSRAEGQKVRDGLPHSIEQARGAVWFIGTHNPVELSLKDGQHSFEMWDDMNGEDPLVRAKAARPFISDGEGGQIENNFVYLFPTDLESFTGRRAVRNMPESRNLTGVTRVDPKTGETYTAAVGIPVRFDNRGNEPMNSDNLACSYRLHNDASNYLASIVLSDSKARSIAIKHGLCLSLPGRERIDGSSYYTLGQVFMDQVWNKKEGKMVPNPHSSPVNLTLTENYISLLEGGRNYPLNCIPMPRGQYFTQDDAALRQKMSEGEKFVSAEGRFISDLMMSLQIANATAIALGVPLRFPLDKDGRIDLGPGVPEEFRRLAESRIDSFIGVRKEEEQVIGKLPVIERIPLFEAGAVRDHLVKSGTDLYMRPNDLAVAFGQYDFSTILAGGRAPLHEMSFRMEDGTVFTVKDSKSNYGMDLDEVNKYLDYSKNDVRRFIIRSTDVDKVPFFINALKAYSDRAKAVKVDVRLVWENEVRNASMEGFVNLLSSNSDEFATSEHDIGREMTHFNAKGTVSQMKVKDASGKEKIVDGGLTERDVDGNKVEEGYWGKVDARDGFRGYAQIRYTLPDGTESSWRTITDLELAKDTVMSLVNRTYKMDSRVVPAPQVMEMLHKAEAVRFAGASFRDFAWSSNRKVEVDDKVVELGHHTVPAEAPSPSVTSVKVEMASAPWTRESVQKDSRTLYVFTDNTDRDSGRGVIDRQSDYYKRYGNGRDDLHFPTMTAAVIRGLDNAMPVSTQRYYHDGAKGEAGRWHDKDAEEFREVISREFSDLRDKLAGGGYDRVVFPGGDGLFNGKISAITKERTPELYAILEQEYNAFVSSLGVAVEEPQREEVQEKEFQVSEPILFLESKGGYQVRTRENAQADDVDFTIALAMDFDTYGERATRKAAGDSYISSFITDLSASNVKNAVEEIYNSLPEEFQKGEPMGVNFAGNGIYTLAAKGFNQDQVDEFMVKVVSGLQSRGVSFSSIRSGGQTGVDEAALVAGKVCGIPATCLAPKGWLQRNAVGKDVSGEDLFKGRFDSKDYSRLSSFIARPKQKRQGKGVVLN